ncbi:hypothetical protein LJK88_50835 [Paenibacillus sp. P26]|nr:hypothetical protein LJK88_50835 [Paenibacillus sp. P26]
MPKFLLKRWHGMHMVWVFALLLVLTFVLFLFQWVVGVVALILSAVLGYFTLQAERAFRKELNEYVATLSHRVKRAGSEVIHELPIGILLYNEEKVVEWHNPFVAKMLGRESLIGESLLEAFPGLKAKKEKELRLEIAVDKRIYDVQLKPDERLIYFTDITDFKTLAKQYEEEKLSMGIVMMDNLDEATQGLDDQTRSIMMAKVTGEITEWASRNHLYLRRTSSDRYLILMDQRGLKALEQSRFEILDEVRDITIENKFAADT